MEHNPPAPLCKTFLICRQLFQDNVTGEFILIGPTHQVVSPVYPMVGGLSVFAQCTSMQGTYALELQLQDLEGTVHWRHHLAPPLEHHDPLDICYLKLQNLGVYFPTAGKFELVLLANGDEVARTMFWARLAAA